VMVIQSLLARGWPTQASSSSRVSKVRMRSL
jgi:hypothetical protein